MLCYVISDNLLVMGRAQVKMPGTGPKRKDNYRSKYSQIDVQAAVDSVRNRGLSLREAQQKYQAVILKLIYHTYLKQHYT